MSKGWDCQGPRKGPQGVARTIQKQKKTGKMWCSGSSVKKVFQREGSDQPYPMP